MRTSRLVIPRRAHTRVHSTTRVGVAMARKMPVKVRPDDCSYDESLVPRASCPRRGDNRFLMRRAVPFDAPRTRAALVVTQIRAAVTIYNSYRNNAVIHARYFMPPYITGYSYLADFIPLAFNNRSSGRVALRHRRSFRSDVLT